MLGPNPKHATLDSQGQNAALHHLRQNGIQPQMENHHQQNGANNNSSDSFASPDALRDTANRLFTRNHNERASFGGVATAVGLTPPGGAQQLVNQRPNMSQMQQQQQPQQQHHMGGPARFSTPVLSGRPQPQPQQQQQQQQQQMTSLPLDSGTKRLSYTNQSFRKALDQEQQQLQMGKVPPQVPPKPFSRSTSRERLKDEIPNDSNAAANALDDELRNILSGGRGGGFGTSSGTPLPNRPMVGNGKPITLHLGKDSYRPEQHLISSVFWPSLADGTHPPPTMRTMTTKRPRRPLTWVMQPPSGNNLTASKTCTLRSSSSSVCVSTDGRLITPTEEGEESNLAQEGFKVSISPTFYEQLFG